jgi:hypothetical protein
MTEQECKEKIL